MNTRQSPVAGPSSPLLCVCSEIGRGHPSYLDSVLAVLDRLQAAPTSGLAHDPESAEDSGHVPRLTVPELCSGVSGLAWGLAGTAYRIGSQGGLFTSLYNGVRPAEGRPSSLQLSILGCGVRKQLQGLEGICLVDHPLLAHILAPVCRVAYIHGEIAAPRAAAVPGAWRTFVPLQTTSLKLQAFGVKPEALSVTGLLIEPDLVAAADASYQARLIRLESDRPLVAGLFLSGARPRPHVSRLIACVESLARSGHRSFLFPGPGESAADDLRTAIKRRGVPEDAFHVVYSRARKDETRRTAELLPSLDVMVAAAHERTNWAVGLGLPMFALLPHIGPFARENFEFASAQAVCIPLATTADAATLGPALDQLRRAGRLAAMARNGWGRHAINGAAATAREILSAITSR